MRFLLLFCFLSVHFFAFSQWSLTNLSAHTQNFNSIGNASNASLPNGFGSTNGTNFDFSTAVTSTTHAAGTTGSGVLNGSSAGGFYNFANGITASSTDRAIGFLTSGSYSSPRHLIAQLRNQTGSPLSGFNLQFDIEKYRSGSRAVNINTFYSLDGINWVAISAGDHSFAADANNTTINNPPATFAKSATVSSISIPNNNIFFLRFTYVGVGGSSNAQAIGIDNISIQPTANNQVPTVQNNFTSQVTTTSFRISFSVTNQGNSPITAIGSYYGFVSPTTSNPSSLPNPGLGNFLDTRTNLQPNTNHYVRPYAINNSGTGFGSEIQVTTLSLSPISFLENNITSNSISFSWALPPNQGNAPVTYQLQASTVNNFSNIIQNITNIPENVPNYTINGLLPNTNYWFRVRINNGQGASAWTAKGAIKTLQIAEKDTIKVLHYNLLNYGYYPSFCPLIDNNANLKDGYLQTILNYVNPDVFAVNELGSGATNANRILNNVLSTLPKSYSRANSTNPLNSNIVNMLYFNNAKLALHSQFQIFRDLNNNNLTRNIDIYKLYYKDPLLNSVPDTTFIYFIELHAKAGSTASDQTNRALETQALMQYLQANQIDGNICLMGDFNARSSNESSIQNLINWSNNNYNFEDPINQLGTWYNNGNFASLHNQSTRDNTNTNNGCFASGGSDDRFDIIFINKTIKNKSQKVAYVPNSYTTIGQDGNRFNNNLLQPTNSSAPNNVISALYENSDHLPVSVNLEFSLIQNPLPVVWSSFSATTSNNFAKLNWTTSSEINNRHFEIEKSTNLTDFSAIGTQYPNQTQQYTFYDYYPLSQTTYYRIKQIDFDGNFNYSKTIALSAKEKNMQLTHIETNQNQWLLQINNVTTHSITARIIDMYGREITKITTSSPEKGQIQLTLNTSQIQNGIYILQVVGNNQLINTKIIYTK